MHVFGRAPTLIRTASVLPRSLSQSNLEGFKTRSGGVPQQQSRRISMVAHPMTKGGATHVQYQLDDKDKAVYRQAVEKDLIPKGSVPPDALGHSPIPRPKSGESLPEGQHWRMTEQEVHRDNETTVHKYVEASAKNAGDDHVRPLGEKGVAMHIATITEEQAVTIHQIKGEPVFPNFATAGGKAPNCVTGMISITEKLFPGKGIAVVPYEYPLEALLRVGPMAVQAAKDITH